MTPLNESSRRAFLTALAATGATAAVVATSDIAHAADDPGSGAGIGAGNDAGVLRTEAFPAATPGTHYKFIQGSDFLPVEGATAYTKGFLQIETGAAAAVFYYSLDDLPPGARITEVTFAVIKSATYTGGAQYFAYRGGSGTFTALDTRNNTALLAQPAEQYVSLVVDPSNAGWVADNELANSQILVVTLVSSRVNSVRVGWVPGPTTPLSFIPITPKRVYDSRFIAPLGPLPSGGNRVISVANGYATDSNVLDLPNVVPPGAVAISYNLTIANTIGAGFLSVNPGDAAVLGGSSINWFQAGMSLANGLTVKLDSNRQVKVFCGNGGGSADFIIDILGYYY